MLDLCCTASEFLLLSFTQLRVNSMQQSSCRQPSASFRVGFRRSAVFDTAGVFPVAVLTQMR